MSRNAGLSFLAIPIAVVAAVWLLRPGDLPPADVVASGDTVLQSGIATNTSAMVTALAPTPTIHRSVTPTRTPPPPTHTPHPTYGPQASPGIYVIPKWTAVPPVAETVDADIPLCTTAEATKYKDTYCEVKP